MVQAPPKPIEPTEPQINIELEDLRELARINPLAWEQLLHIADKRLDRDCILEQIGRIEVLEGQLAKAHETLSAMGAESYSKNGKATESSAKT